ncbi:hypothetical protein BDZ89DRAFT_176467 [Hymenopellis radicata]|nr:hypothetical protein BDZ89DRAFT_176467 [Hymenopellis radicata]
MQPMLDCMSALSWTYRPAARSDTVQRAWLSGRRLMALAIAITHRVTFGPGRRQVSVLPEDCAVCAPDGTCDSFDDMDIKPELLRCVYGYGFERRAVVSIVTFSTPSR